MQRYKVLFINQLQKWTFLSDEVRKKCSAGCTHQDYVSAPRTYGCVVIASVSPVDAPAQFALVVGAHIAPNFVIAYPKSLRQRV